VKAVPGKSAEFQFNQNSCGMQVNHTGAKNSSENQSRW